MKLTWLLRPLALTLVAGLTVTAQQTATPNGAAPVRQAAPAAAGVSAERFQRLHQAMQGFVDRKEVSGIVTLVTREGRTADLHAVGFQDVESKTPMKTDTIFRIASMTKAVVSVGIMMLVEEGRLSISDPV